MIIYLNITARQTDGQTHQNYSSEPHKKKRTKADNVCKDRRLFFWIVNVCRTYIKVVLKT